MHIVTEPLPSGTTFLTFFTLGESQHILKAVRYSNHNSFHFEGCMGYRMIYHLTIIWYFQSKVNITSTLLFLNRSKKKPGIIFLSFTVYISMGLIFLFLVFINPTWENMTYCSQKKSPITTNLW